MHGRSEWSSLNPVLVGFVSDPTVKVLFDPSRHNWKRFEFIKLSTCWKSQLHAFNHNWPEGNTDAKTPYKWENVAYFATLEMFLHMRIYNNTPVQNHHITDFWMKEWGGGRVAATGQLPLLATRLHCKLRHIDFCWVGSIFLSQLACSIDAKKKSGALKRTFWPQLVQQRILFAIMSMQHILICICICSHLIACDNFICRNVNATNSEIWGCRRMM